MIVCALLCAGCMAQKLTSESKDAVKKDLKMFEKAGWKGAGADSDMKKAIERSYGYIQDTLNYVTAQAAASQIDAKNAIAIATQIAQKKALEKAGEVLRARGERIKDVLGDQEAFPILTLYRNQKKKEDGSQGYVRVALKITK